MAWAADPVVATAASDPAAAVAAAEAPARARTQVTVIEDEGVRIEETRLRGAAQRIVVQSKLPGTPAYEIQVAPAGRDPNQDRSSTGRRTWSLLRF